VNLGVLPFWSDIVSFVERVSDWKAKLDDLEVRLRDGLRVVHKVPREVTSVIEPSYPWVGGSKTVETYTRIWGGYVIGNLGYYHDRENDGGLDAIRSTGLRWGLIPDLGVLWNATPFSFLVDYLIPLGEILSSQHYLLNAQIVQQWYSSKRVTSVELFDFYPSGSSEPRATSSNDCPRGLVVQGNRTVYFRTPAPWGKMDDISVNLRTGIARLNPRKWANIMALINSFTLRRP